MTKENKLEDIDPKDLKIEFAPGCFDNFEGTQEELDALIADITEMFRSGEAQKKAKPLNFDDLDEQDIEILERMAEIEAQSSRRKLQ